MNPKNKDLEELPDAPDSPPIEAALPQPKDDLEMTDADLRKYSLVSFLTTLPELSEQLSFRMQGQQSKNEQFSKRIEASCQTFVDLLLNTDHPEGLSTEDLDSWKDLRSTS